MIRYQRPKINFLTSRGQEQIFVEKIFPLAWFSLVYSASWGEVVRSAYLGVWGEAPRSKKDGNRQQAISILFGQVCTHLQCLLSIYLHLIPEQFPPKNADVGFVVIHFLPELDALFFEQPSQKSFL